MKFLLALTFLLAFLALALTEPDTDRDVELLRDNLVVRDKREPAGGNRNTGTKGKKAAEGKKGKKGKTSRRTGRKVARGGKGGNKNRKNKNKNKIKRKKDKKKRKKGKRGQKKKDKRRQRGRNAKTCSDLTTVNSTCLEVRFLSFNISDSIEISEQDAVYVLKFLKNQVRSFNRKFSRIKNFNTTMGNKLGKKGVFSDSANYLLMALGWFVANYNI